MEYMLIHLQFKTNFIIIKEDTLLFIKLSEDGMKMIEVDFDTNVDLFKLYFSRLSGIKYSFKYDDSTVIRVDVLLELLASCSIQ